MTLSNVTGTLGSRKRVLEVMMILTVPRRLAVKDSPLAVLIVTGSIHSMVWNREMSVDRWLVVAELISQVWAPLLMRGTVVGSSYSILIPGASESDATMIMLLPFLSAG